MFAEIAARIVDVSTLVNLSPLDERRPKKLTRIKARIIQKSGPRRTLRARALVKVIFFLLDGLAFFEFFSGHEYICFARTPMKSRFRYFSLKSSP